MAKGLLNQHTIQTFVVLYVREKDRRTLRKSEFLRRNSYSCDDPTKTTCVGHVTLGGVEEAQPAG